MCGTEMAADWANSERQVVKFTKYEKLELNETEQKGILTDKIIASCSSYLDRNPVTNEYTLCKLELPRKVSVYVQGYRFFPFLTILQCSALQ